MAVKKLLGRYWAMVLLAGVLAGAGYLLLLSLDAPAQLSYRPSDRAGSLAQTVRPAPIRPSITSLPSLSSEAAKAPDVATSGPLPTTPEAVRLSGYSDEALRQILANEPLKPAAGTWPLNFTYSPIAAATIGYRVFEQALADGRSPALPEAATMYQVCLLEGCDPALALAFFDHESSLGTKGVAVQTHSIGNLRCTRDVLCLATESNGSFQGYLSWTEGVRAWATLLRETYLRKWQLTTLEQIIPRYAPGDQAIEYVKSVKIKVDNLRLRGRLR